MPTDPKERAKDQVDPRKFNDYQAYQKALRQKEDELLLADAKAERIEREKEAERTKRRDEIRRELNQETEKTSGGQVCGNTSDEEAETELRRREAEEDDWSSYYRG